MQAILLSAGRGQRLAPLTDSIPKPLVQVAGKALIDHQLEKFSDAGIHHVVINAGWLGQQLIEHVGTGKKYGLRVTYSVEPSKALETAGGIIQALPLLDDKPFIVCNSDVIHTFDFSTLSTIDMQQFEAHLILIENPLHNPSGDFVLNKDVVVNKVNGGSIDAFTYSGISCYQKSFFSGLTTGRRKLGDLLRAKVEAGKVSGQYFSGAWFDAGTEERILVIENYLATQ